MRCSICARRYGVRWYWVPGWLPSWTRLCLGHAAPDVRRAWRRLGARV